MQLQQQLLQQQQKIIDKRDENIATKPKQTAPRKPSLDNTHAPEQAWEEPKHKRMSGRKRTVTGDMETGDELPQLSQPQSRDHSRETDNDSIISQHLQENHHHNTQENLKLN